MRFTNTFRDTVVGSTIPNQNEHELKSDPMTNWNISIKSDIQVSVIVGIIGSSIVVVVVLVDSASLLP